MQQSFGFGEAEGQCSADLRGGEWHDFLTLVELKRYARDQAVYTQAFVWRSDESTFVSIFYTSPSGDWADYLDLCFRNDGTLARSQSTLNTFNVAGPEGGDEAPVSRIRTRYFTGRGPAFHTRVRVLDLKTKKPAPKRSFMDQDEPVFPRIEDLPFATLLLASRQPAGQGKQPKTPSFLRRAAPPPTNRGAPCIPLLMRLSSSR
jgi:hypothetical protein